jgi:hypothetical protein
MAERWKVGKVDGVTGAQGQYKPLYGFNITNERDRVLVQFIYEERGRGALGVAARNPRFLPLTRRPYLTRLVLVRRISGGRCAWNRRTLRDYSNNRSKNHAKSLISHALQRSREPWRKIIPSYRLNAGRWSPIWARHNSQSPTEGRPATTRWD